MQLSSFSRATSLALHETDSLLGRIVQNDLWIKADSKRHLQRSVLKSPVVAAEQKAQDGPVPTHISRNGSQ
jgi:hypothetical protein